MSGSWNLGTPFVYNGHWCIWAWAVASPPCWHPRKSHGSCYFSHHTGHYLTPTMTSPHCSHQCIGSAHLFISLCFSVNFHDFSTGIKDLDSLPCSWGALDGSGVFCLNTAHRVAVLTLPFPVSTVRDGSGWEWKGLGSCLYIISTLGLETSGSISLCGAFSLSSLALPVPFTARQRQLIAKSLHELQLLAHQWKNLENVCGGRVGGRCLNRFAFLTATEKWWITANAGRWGWPGNVTDYS